MTDLTPREIARCLRWRPDEVLAAVLLEALMRLSVDIVGVHVEEARVRILVVDRVKGTPLRMDVPLCPATDDDIWAHVRLSTGDGYAYVVEQGELVWEGYPARD